MKVLMFKVGAPIVAAMMLVGCTKTVAEMSFSERESLAGQIQQRCLAQGTKIGTERYKSCIQVEAQREVATRQRRATVEDARRSQNTTSFCQAFGNTIQCF